MVNLLKILSLFSDTYHFILVLDKYTELLEEGDDKNKKFKVVTL